MRAAGWLLLALFPLSLSAAEHCGGRVLKVADGDTLELECDGRPMRVRLSQIDAPEFRQAHGLRARNALQGLVAGRRVQLEIHGRDAYDRPLATVRLDGLDVNREMLRRGHAWAYRRGLRDPSLLDDEAYARERRLGLWSAPDPLPPWQFRAAVKH
jgi:endonuclease YncB( thermonuclease family)